MGGESCVVCIHGNGLTNPDDTCSLFIHQNSLDDDYLIEEYIEKTHKQNDAFFETLRSYAEENHIYIVKPDVERFLRTLLSIHKNIINQNIFHFSKLKLYLKNSVFMVFYR